MRIHVLRAVSMLAIASFALVGCKASLKVGGKQPPPPPPPAKPEPPKPAPEKKPPAPKFGNFKFKVDKDGKVELPEPIYFETGTATIKPESEAVLTLVWKYLTLTPDITKMRIEGHTDSVGNDASNQTLSEQRAMAVALWITAKGIKCDRLLPVGFGEGRPVVTPENTPDDRAVNRRVDFINAERGGEPIKGLPIDGGGKGKIAGDPCNPTG